MRYHRRLGLISLCTIALLLLTTTPAAAENVYITDATANLAGGTSDPYNGDFGTMASGNTAASRYIANIAVESHGYNCDGGCHRVSNPVDSCTNCTFKLVEAYMCQGSPNCNYLHWVTTYHYWWDPAFPDYYVRYTSSDSSHSCYYYWVTQYPDPNTPCY